jgi:hypothetical protein
VRDNEILSWVLSVLLERSIRVQGRVWNQGAVDGFNIRWQGNPASCSIRQSNYTSQTMSGRERAEALTHFLVSPSQQRVISAQLVQIEVRRAIDSEETPLPASATAFGGCCMVHPRRTPYRVSEMLLRIELVKSMIRQAAVILVVSPRRQQSFPRKVR